MEIYGYTRISVDIEQDRDNTSIENQKEIITSYVEQHFPTAHLTLFADRDRSGYTFSQREDYQRMRSGLMDGTCKTLIVKDFSRFSRRNSLGLLELETLRDAGVRIISIGDGIDYPTRDDWILIQFKFLMNEMPVTDTSRKIKQIVANRQKRGKWVCAVPYGYRLINTKEMTYEIDPPAAEIVREVFRLYCNGWGYMKIANHLTELGVPTPRQNEITRKEAAGQSTTLKAKNAWAIVTIQKMLQNDFYIGTLRQRKYQRVRINGVDKRTDEEEQIVIENAHTPIIENSTFAYAQELLRQRTTNHYRGEKKYPTDYSGFLFCADCGSPMFSRSSTRLTPSYVCGTYLRRGLKGCTAHTVYVPDLDEKLKKTVRRIMDNSQDMMEQMEQAISNQPHREAELGSVIDTLNRQLEESQEQLKTLLKRKVLDTVGKTPQEAELLTEAYNELEKELTQRIQSIESQIDENIDLRNTVIQTNRTAQTVMDVFHRIMDKPKLDKRDIALLVDKIIVGDGCTDIHLHPDVENLFHLDQSCINVVNDGDPLEIYTTRDGEVIFKKYSLLGALEDFAGQFCDTLSRSTEFTVAVTDRDAVIAAAGPGRRELLGKTVSQPLAERMEERGVWCAPQGQMLPACEGVKDFQAALAAPILCQGDVLGLVLFLTDRDAAAGETEIKLAETVAAFLGRHMEN